jgi:DNA polymerase elongation subunit (family B)
MAKKISLNSAYGAIGNQYFRYFKLANAEAITLSGQVSIRWIENKMNEYLNKLLQTEGEDYVIASDTELNFLVISLVIKQRLLEYLIRSVKTSWNHSSNPVIRNLRIMFRHMSRR